jgi:ribosomal protein S8
MKLTYLPLWNKIKNALLKKQLITKINFSYQNLKLLKFLLKNNFISGFEKRGSSKKAFLIIFLKYDLNYLTAIHDFSLVSLPNKRRPKQKSNKQTNENFVINLFSSENNNNTLLAKFR